MKPKRLLLAGSHAGATAISVVKEIKKRGIKWDLFWIGKKYATEEKKSYTLEFNSLPGLGVKFCPVETGKVQTKFTRYTIPALLTIPFGFLASGIQVAKIRPDLILSFGGAAGAEVSFWGWLMGIPVIIHEQTATAGRANIFSSRFAKAVAISRSNSAKYFPGKNVILTGNPISSEIALSEFKPRNKPQTVFVTGGSRGSKWINGPVWEILPKLLTEYKVVHQYGLDNNPGAKWSRDGYTGYGQIPYDKWPNILKSADIVVSRAGANIVSELIAAKKPCVLIPIPWSYNNEQNENAALAKNFGIARVLPQNKLNGKSLEFEIEKLRSDYPKIIKNVARKNSPDIHASESLVNLLEKYIK